MNDMSIRNNPTRKHGLRTLGFLAIAGVLTTAARSQASMICPFPSQGGPNPVLAILDQGSADCWTGSSWDTGTSWALGGVTTTSGVGRSVGAYAFWGLEHNPAPWMQGTTRYAISRAFDANNTYKCEAHDFTGDGSWEYNTSSDCNSAVYVIVNAEGDIVG